MLSICTPHTVSYGLDEGPEKHTIRGYQYVASLFAHKGTWNVLGVPDPTYLGLHLLV